MAIVTDSRGNIFLEFINIEYDKVTTITLDAPVTHALIVAKYQGKYLFMHNKWRKNWELPGGIIEAGENAQQCVIRELFEETNQNIDTVEFKGLMKFRLQPRFMDLNGRSMELCLWVNCTNLMILLKMMKLLQLSFGTVHQRLVISLK